MSEWTDTMRTAILQKDRASVARLCEGEPPLNAATFETHLDQVAPLHFAIEYGTPEIMTLLLQAGADPNVRAEQKQTTPLMTAAYRGKRNFVQLLLQARANPRLVDVNGISALANAAWGGKSAVYVQIAQLLLDAEAVPDAEALVAAARHSSPDMIRLLVSAGADVNEISRWGTALILAVAEKRADNVTALLAVGADPQLHLPADHRNYPGKSALDVARETRSRPILALLEAAETT